jgi:RND family efflux transporter MFP subunit
MRVIVLAVAAMVLSACSEPAPVEKAARAVLVRDLAGDTTPSQPNVYVGTVSARFESDLAFRIGGKLVERRVDTGDQVKRGQVLARLDPSDVELAARAAMAQLAAAEADLTLARAELKRGEDLHGSNFISASALDARRTTVQAAEARMRQARAQADVAGNQADYAVLRSDRDGVVVAAPVDPGQVLAAGQAVVRVAQPDEREIVIHVPESRVRGYSMGQAAAVRPWAVEDKVYAGSVREIAPAADAATRSYAVRVSVPQADELLPLGATASVAFASTDAAQIIVPMAAVTAIDGVATVWVVDKASRLQPVEVSIGMLREDGVVISSGLPADARVVVAGVHKLIAGEVVRAVAETAPVALDAKR